MKKAVAISPHLDDAVFSAGGAIALLARRGWSVTVMTVFTASVPSPQGFALACQLDKGLPPDLDYMALRRAEDRAACEALGAAPMWLALPEAPHRGYGSAAELFGAVRPDDRIDVRDAIRRRLRTLQPDLLLVPQALGGHVDHVHVGRVAMDLGAADAVLWWRDFPYAAKPTPPEPFAVEMGRRPEVTVSLDAEASDRKQRACLAYASQLGFQFGGEDGLRRILRGQDGVERYRLHGLPPW